MQCAVAGQVVQHGACALLLQRRPAQEDPLQRLHKPPLACASRKASPGAGVGIEHVIRCIPQQREHVPQQHFQFVTAAIAVGRRGGEGGVRLLLVGAWGEGGCAGAVEDVDEDREA